LNIANTDGAYLMQRIRALSHEDGGCLIWEGRVNEAGLPSYGRSSSARRRIWLALNGEIPPGYFVGCDCGEKLCLEPKHLILRTKSSIVKSGWTTPAKAKRVRAIKLTARSKAKLTDQAVQEIRESTAPLKELAERFGVHFSLIGKVRQGHAWKPLNSPFAGLGARP
jgi:hypothetical protein